MEPENGLHDPNLSDPIFRPIPFNDRKIVEGESTFQENTQNRICVPTDLPGSTILNGSTQLNGSHNSTLEGSLTPKCEQPYSYGKGKENQLDIDQKLEELKHLVQQNFGESLSCMPIITSKGYKFVSISEEIPGDGEGDAILSMKFLPLFYIVGTVKADLNIELKLIAFNGKVLEQLQGTPDQPLNDERKVKFIDKLRQIHLCEGVKFPNLDSKYDLRMLLKSYLIECLEENVIIRSRNCKFVVYKDGGSSVCGTCATYDKNWSSKKKRNRTSDIKKSLTIFSEENSALISSNPFETDYSEGQKPQIKTETDAVDEFQGDEEMGDLSTSEDYSLINSEITEDENNIDYQWNVNPLKESADISDNKFGISKQKVKTKCHTCKYCSYVFTNKAELLEHVKTNHSDVKPYSCELCNFKAKDKRALDHHVISNHDQSKAYLCEHCSYSTPSKGRLTCHIKAVHDKCKPFICEHCSFATAAKAHLDNHIAVVHNKIKPFKCSQCPYRAANGRDMKRHVKEVHEKVRPFSCHLCPYKAGRRVLMTKHMTKMHNENKLPTRKVKYNKVSNPNSNLGYYKNKSDYDLPEFKGDNISFQTNS